MAQNKGGKWTLRNDFLLPFPFSFLTPERLKNNGICGSSIYNQAYVKNAILVTSKCVVKSKFLNGFLQSHLQLL